MVIAEQHEDDLAIFVLHKEGNLLLTGFGRLISVQLALDQDKFIVDFELSAGIKVDLLADLVLKGEEGGKIEKQVLCLFRKLLVLFSGKFEQDLIQVLIIFGDFVPCHCVILLADVKWFRVKRQILPVSEIIQSLKSEIFVILHRPCEILSVVFYEITESDDVVIVLVELEDFLYTSVAG